MHWSEIYDPKPNQLFLSQAPIPSNSFPKTDRQPLARHPTEKLKTKHAKTMQICNLSTCFSTRITQLSSVLRIPNLHPNLWFSRVCPNPRIFAAVSDGFGKSVRYINVA